MFFQQMKPFFLRINHLKKEPYCKILGYPKASRSQISSRIDELKRNGIYSVAFWGKTNLGKVNVLGKGYVGIVVLAKKKQKGIVAIKIRRSDAQRKELKTEAGFLKKANTVNVGPKLISSSKNFLVMEYIEGEKIGNWINNLPTRGSTKILKKVIKKILEDCFSLDQIGLDHGELSSISKHVIVGKTIPTIIDFESSSTQRRISNLTSATQGIFIGSGISKKIRKIYNVPTKSVIINQLRRYKKDPSKENFMKLLKLLKL